MTARPRLTRSIPFWILIAGSLASIALGTWLVVDKIATMSATLLDGTATGVEVYGGQSWVTLGAALVGAGLVGLVASLFLAVLRSFVPVAPVESIDWDAETETLTDAEPETLTDAEPVDEAVPATTR
jgi:hypothetical protein